MVSPTELSFGYHAIEDRLVVLVGQADEATPLQMTRRLADRFVNALAHVLKKSSAAARHAPSEVQDDVVLLEHQRATRNSGSAQGAHHGPDVASGEPSPRANAHLQQAGAGVLIHSVRLTTKPAGFVLVFNDAKGPLAELTLGRQDVHRILEMVLKFARRADWRLSVNAQWLSIEQTEIVLN